MSYSSDVVSVVFAKAFRRHVDCPDAEFGGATVGAVLDAYFQEHPQVRGYVLDEAGAVRKHVAVFVDDDVIADRTGLSDDVTDGGRVHVFQALSGGST